MEDNYPKAYKEVIEILKYLPQESVNKIPNNMLEMFETKMDKEYFFTVDIDKTFEEQTLMKETESILANIFRDYWATQYQKERILAKENYDRQKAEEEKAKKYNSNDIFKNNTKIIQDDKQEEISHLPIEIKKEKFYEKLINFIKKLFHFKDL